MICEEHTTSGNIIVFSTSELLDECDATTEIFTMKMSRNTLELCIYSWPEFVHVFQPFNRDNLFITFHAHCYLQYIHHCSDTCCNMDASQIGYPVGTIITNLQYSLAWYHTILIHKLLQNYPNWFAQHLEYLQNGEPHTQNSFPLGHTVIPYHGRLAYQLGTKSDAFSNNFTRYGKSTCLDHLLLKSLSFHVHIVRPQFMLTCSWCVFPCNFHCIGI